MKAKLKIFSFIFFIICLTSFSRGQDLVVEKINTSSKKQSDNNSEQTTKLYVASGTTVSIKNESVSKNVEIVYVNTHKTEKRVEKKSVNFSKKEIVKTTSNKKTEEKPQEVPLRIRKTVNQSSPVSLNNLVTKNTIALTNHHDYSKARIQKNTFTPVLTFETKFIKEKKSYQKFSKIKKGFYDTYAIRPPPTSYFIT